MDDHSSVSIFSRMYRSIYSRRKIKIDKWNDFGGWKRTKRNKMEAKDKSNLDREDDKTKAFLSRVPTNINEDELLKLLKKELGDSVVEVSTVKDNENETSMDSKIKEMKDVVHKGYAFVQFSSIDACAKAIEKGSIATKTRTMYIRDIVRDTTKRKVCYLWSLGRCTHGESCQFEHVGEGSCISTSSMSYSDKMKKRNCFSFMKTGKCKRGDQCLFSHDCYKPKCVVIKSNETNDKKENKENKDCINWKTKGKCRKGDKCPYKHDPIIQQKALRKRKREKKRQPLSIRIFGLNYETTENQVYKCFEECGKIVEITFPKFEDSGRSKGFCGILFQSPKAVEKAIEKDGMELDGRWLRVQAGKMYLKQWEENIAKVEKEKKELIGEYGQKVKRRKRHGYDN